MKKWSEEDMRVREVVTETVAGVIIYAVIMGAITMFALPKTSILASIIMKICYGVLFAITYIWICFIDMGVFYFLQSIVINKAQLNLKLYLFLIKLFVFFISFITLYLYIINVKCFTATVEIILSIVFAIPITIKAICDVKLSEE